MTTRKTYYPLPGGIDILDAALAYVKVLEVDRSGVVYDIINSNNDVFLNSRQVRYASAFGALVFNDQIPFNENESINVIYETNP